MHKIRYTPEFVEDIEKIQKDIQIISGSKSIADKYIRKFVLNIKKKQQFPESESPLYFRDIFTGFYFIHFKAYNAFYEIKDGYIEGARALPSKSDYLKILFGEYYEEDLNLSDETDYLNESAEE